MVVLEEVRDVSDVSINAQKVPGRVMYFDLRASNINIYFQPNYEKSMFG